MYYLTFHFFTVRFRVIVLHYDLNAPDTTYCDSFIQKAFEFKKQSVENTSLIYT